MCIRDRLNSASALGEKTEHQVLDRNVLILKLSRDLLGESQHSRNRARRVKLIRAARNLRETVYRRVKLALHSADNIGVAGLLTDPVDQRADETSVLRQEDVYKRQGLGSALAGEKEVASTVAKVSTNLQKKLDSINEFLSK